MCLSEASSLFTGPLEHLAGLGSVSGPDYRSAWSKCIRFRAGAPYYIGSTNVYRATKDLFLTQRFARHANPITTVAYTHPSDEELYSAIAGI